MIRYVLDNSEEVIPRCRIDDPEMTYQEPHDWQEAEKDVRNKKEGTWHECLKCKMRIFYPDGSSAFQQHVILIVKATDFLTRIIKEGGFKSELRRVDGEDGKYGEKRSAGADMAYYCDYAREMTIYDVQTS